MPSKNVSFFKDAPNSRKTLDRRRAYAEALMNQKTPGNEMVGGIVVKKSPIEGLSRALQQGVGGYLSGKIDKEEDQREQNANQTLASALETYGRQQANDPTQLSTGETINWNPTSPDKSNDMMVRALMGNPDTAPLGMQTALGRMESKQKISDELDLYKQKFPLELELARAKASIEGGGGPFKGSSMDAQTNNILLQGDPASPEYAAAYASQAAPKVLPNGMMITPDMSPFRQPIRGNENSELDVQPMNEGDVVNALENKPYGSPTITPPTMMNDAQSVSALYADRMANSNPIINETTQSGLDPTQASLASIPILGNYLVTDDYRSLNQAQRDFVNATLRRESGAVISPSEFENAKKQYFPVPGDDEKTLANKKKNRETAMGGVMRAAGPAYKPPVDEYGKMAQEAINAGENPNLVRKKYKELTGREF